MTHPSSFLLVLIFMAQCHHAAASLVLGTFVGWLLGIHNIPGSDAFSQPRRSNRSSGKNKAIEINKEIVQYGNQRKWKEILTLYEDNKDSFSHINYATAMSRLGRIRSLRKNDPAFLAMLSDLKKRLTSEDAPDWIGTRELANIAHASAKMRLGRNQDARAIVRSLDQHAEWLVTNGEPQTIANSVWACAALGLPSPHLFCELEKRASWLVQNGTPQAIANSAWACATLGVKSPQLFGEIDKRASWLVKSGKPQVVANSVWACATLGVQSPQLFGELEKRASWLVENGKPQEIANSVWACATLGVEAPLLFGELEKWASWMFESGKPQEIANCVWACATLGKESPQLFGKLEERALWLVENGNTQDVANTVWACATMGVESPQLFGELEKRASWMFESGKLQEFINSIWACATLKVESPQLFGELERRAAWVVENGNTQDVANSAWAYASLRVQSPELFGELEKRASWLAKKGKPQEIANVVWASGVLGATNDNLLSAISDETIDRLIKCGDEQLLSNICYGIVCSNECSGNNNGALVISRLWPILITQDPKKLPVEYLRQIAYIRAICGAEGLQLDDPPAAFHDRSKSIEFDMEQSKAQLDISRKLAKLGFRHSCEFSPFEEYPGLMAIDMACEERMIAVEFDGPSHFVKDGHFRETKIRNGATKTKRRVLESLGWKVVNLDWKDAVQNKRSMEWLEREVVHKIDRCE